MAAKLPDIEIIIGTYEEFLLGYQLIQQDEKITLKQTFADKSHAGSLKCVAVHGHWIASGGSDDRIFIYDMRTRKQSQILLSHEGTINSLVFSPDLTHLLSGSADGHMIATRVSNWTPEGDWRKAHAGAPVTHISCHPSSKLALSLGTDQVLQTWNLIKGRVAYKTNLKSKRTLGSAPDCLTWSTDGAHFTLSGPLVFEIWEIKSASVVRREKMPSKPICVVWLNENVCVVGLENGSIAWITLDAAENSPIKVISAHDARVKCISYFQDTLVTVSSSGEIKVWRCSVDDKELSLITNTHIDCRPTCMGLLDLNQPGILRPPVLKSTSHPSLKSRSSDNKKSQSNELAAPAPRGFVTITFDEDETENPGETEKPTKQKSKQKAKPKKRPAPVQEEEDSSEVDDDDNSDVDDDNSASSSDNEIHKKKAKKSQPPKSIPKRKFNKINKK